MTTKALLAGISATLCTTVVSAGIFVDNVNDAGNIRHTHSGQIATFNGTTTPSNSAFVSVTDTLRLTGLDTQDDVLADTSLVPLRTNSRQTMLRTSGAAEINLNTYAMFETLGGEEEEEEEPEEFFTGIQSQLVVNVNTFAGVYGNSNTTGFSSRVSESNINLAAPAYHRHHTENPEGTGDYREFSIEGVLGQNERDTVDIEWSTQFNTQSRYGGTVEPDGVTNGWLLETDLTFDVVINDVSQTVTVVENGGELTGSFTAEIGDIIGIDYDQISRIGTEGLLALMPPQSPTSPGVNGFANADTVGDFDAVFTMTTTAGVSEDDPVLPSDPPTEPGDSFNMTFIVEEIDGVTPGVDFPIFFDPDVAVGYEILIDGAEVASIVLPNNPVDGDGFEISIFHGGEYENIGQFFNGDEIDVAGDNVTKVLIEGIEESLDLDPLDTEAFAVGLTFQNITDPENVIDVTMDPILVPEPTSLSMLGLGALLILRRRR